MILNKPTLILLIILAGTLKSYSQFSVKIINENFNSNMLRWDIKNTELSEMDLSNGKYTISCKKEGTAITSVIEVPHLQFTNFRISTSLSKLKGIDDNGFGLVWGSKDENNEMEFVISGNGQFKIMKWEEGIKTDIVGWTYSMAINKWDFSKNDLMIESSENLLRFYINGTYVVATKELAHLGDKVGFVLNETMQVQIENLVVENLTEVVTQSPGDINNLTIKDVKYSGSKENEISYNETGYINVELYNSNTAPIKDIIITIKAPDETAGLEFNTITMVDEVAGNHEKTFAIKLIANEEVLTQNNNFYVQLSTFDGKIVGSGNISIHSVGLGTYYSNNKTNANNPTDNTTNNRQSYENRKYNNNSSSDACTKGCSGIGLLSLITALVIAIL